MKNNKQTMEEFLGSSTIAVVGASRDKSKFGNIIYRELKGHGYQALAVNPSADMVEGDRCYAGVGALPEKPDGVILVIPPAEGVKVIEEIARRDIQRVWIQPGANSPELDRKCEELNLSCTSGICILMHLEPVKSIHAVHRFFDRALGKTPK